MNIIEELIKRFQPKEETKEYFDIICPYCFRSFSPEDIVFRAMHSVPDDDEYKLQEDELLNKYRKALKYNPISKIEAVINPKKIYIENVKAPKGVLLEIIDKYGVKSRKRLCPHCHNELSGSFGIGPSNIISIIGSSKVGKSTYMTVLIHTLQNITAKNFNVTFTAASSKYRELLKDFEDKLFDKGELLESESELNSIEHLIIRLKYRDDSIPPVTLIFYDVSSEAMLNQEYLEMYASNIKNSSGIIFLVDPTQLGSLRNGCEESSNEEFYEPRDVIVHLYDNFISLEDEDKTSIPTAIVLTKSDKLKAIKEGCESISDKVFTNYIHSGFFSISEFENINNEIRNFISIVDRPFKNAIDVSFNKAAYFAVSALNSDYKAENSKVEVNPIRVEEPFLWLLYEMNYIKGRRE